MRRLWLIAWTVLIEAVRRREVYVVVLAALLLIGGVMTIDFFNIEGLTKFYREIALKVMSAATVLTVIVLAARQLPREFENRTIYPLLAKPVGRTGFLLGKLLGVMLAAAFCFALFMAAYVAGTLYLKGTIPWGLFAQYMYLQLLMMLILATLCFWLSMMVNLDAAITLGILFYATSATLSSAISYIYDFVGRAGQWVLVGMTYGLPQLTLFDLSGRTVHSSVWDPIPLSVLGGVTLYGCFFAGLYFGLAMLWFRRRPL